MRTLAAILAYLVAAAGGLAAGYYATAPRTVSAYGEASPRSTEPHHDHTGAGEPAALEAVAAFLAAEEAREGAVEPAAAGL
jgi:hypothetical protein